MGNALSNQRVEYLKKSGVDTGALIKLVIEKDNISGETKLKEYGVYPTYVNRYWNNGRLNYDLVKLQDLIKGGRLSDVTSSELKSNADKKYKEALKVLKGEI